MKGRVGDQVRISSRGQDNWRENPHNPYDRSGVIISADEGECGFDFLVRWSNGLTNSYNEEDLDFFPPKEYKLEDYL